MKHIASVAVMSTTAPKFLKAPSALRLIDILISNSFKGMLPLDPILFNIAINCKDDIVLCKGEGQTPVPLRAFQVRAVVFA